MQIWNLLLLSAFMLNHFWFQSWKQLQLCTLPQNMTQILWRWFVHWYWKKKSALCLLWKNIEKNTVWRAGKGLELGRAPGEQQCRAARGLKAPVGLWVPTRQKGYLLSGTLLCHCPLCLWATLNLPLTSGNTATPFLLICSGLALRSTFWKASHEVLREVLWRVIILY